MASLTGTKIKDTYDSLIKVSDNGALDGTLQTLTDGLGNNSALSLSTAGASVTGTLAVSGATTLSGGVSGNVAFDTNTLFVDATNNRVGIGTNNPTYDLTLSKSKAAGNVVFQIENTETTGSSRLWIGNNANSSGARIQYFGETHAARPNLFSIGTDAANDVILETSGSERMRIDSSGNVGIGTSNTGYGKLGVYDASNSLLAIANSTSYCQLQQNGSDLYINTNLSGAAGGSTVFRRGAGSTESMRILSSGGLTFNGDTSSANALDDYEEGTWTPVITDLTNDATMIAGSGGTYTKIGRQVTLTGYVRTSSLGSVTGDIYIKGLPFVVGGSAVGGVSINLGFGTGFNISAGQSVGVYSEGGTRITLTVWDAATGTTPMQASEWTSSGFIFMSFTYFV
jgi:hypothetical protein